MTPYDLLVEFGRCIGAGPLAFDDRGLCRLSFDGTLIVDLECDADAGLLHFYSVLGTIPAMGREALFTAMLAANLFGQDTGGAVLAIDPLRNEVLLCRSLAAEGLDVPDFSAAMAAFVDSADRWGERLAGSLAVPTPPQAEAMVAPAGPGLMASMMLRA